MEVHLLTAKVPAVSVSVELALVVSAVLVPAVPEVSVSVGLALVVSAVSVLAVHVRSQHPPSMVSCNHHCTSRECHRMDNRHKLRHRQTCCSNTSKQPTPIRPGMQRK
jgi:hypothetical protein